MTGNIEKLPASSTLPAAERIFLCLSDPIDDSFQG